MTFSFPTHRTLSIRERLARESRELEVDVQRGDKRLDRWRQAEPFDGSDYFERRLAVDQLSAEQLRDLLGEEGGGDAANGSRAPWALEFEHCFSAEALALPRIEPPANLANVIAFPFWDFIEPIVRHFVHSLVGEVEVLCRQHPEGPLEPQTLEQLIVASLPSELLRWLSRVMALEMNIARLQGELTGDDPRSRFEQFAGRLRDPEVRLDLHRQYPLLARQLVEQATTWHGTTHELLQRLCVDWSEICGTFGLDPADRLARLDLGVGDRHRGGRSVTLLQFVSGDRLVYKPRPMAIDACFQKLLVELSSWGLEPRLEPLTLLDRGKYGWVTFLTPQACSSREEVQRFYRRQGAYLAILYSLCASDIHFENLIAVGEHPFMIDLESLLQPGPPENDPLADDLLRNSIVEVGLLPVRNWENEESPGLDVSGLGGPDGQLPPRPEPYWSDRNTDTMRFARQVRKIKASSSHRPKVEGRSADALEFTDDILAGFTNAYRLILEQRDRLLAEDGPLADFQKTEMRVLLRPTAVYGLMLWESFHPDFLQDGLERDRFFDKLWRHVPHRPFLERVVGDEQEALRRRDIPIFGVDADGRGLRLNSGEVLEDFFTQSPWQRVRQRLASFGAADLDKQLWFIRASLAILSTTDPERESSRVAPTAATRPKDEETSAEGWALHLADHLCEQVLEEDGESRWVGLQPTPQGAFKIALLGSSLYSGQAGVALFLAYAAEIGGSSEHRRLAELAISTVLRRLADEGPPAGYDSLAGNPGAYEGLSGVVYVLTHLGALWRDRALLDAALDLVPRVREAIAEDAQLDVVNGVAGAILALATLRDQVDAEQALDDEQVSDDQVLAAMVEGGERLLAKEIQASEGGGWRTDYSPEAALTGFSHGASGIAAALLEVAAASGDDRFDAAAARAFQFERDRYSAESGNWPDLREGGQAMDQFNWCHGAPGIAIARARALARPAWTHAEEELRHAVDTTLEHGFGRNHSLCHGDLGNLDVLLLAADACPELDLRPRIEALGEEILTNLGQQGWRCGLPMEVETPGLMVGVAGIGLGLLRMAAPRRVPSVLSLAPPTARDA